MERRETGGGEVTDDEIRDKARELYAYDGEIEIDGNAVVSRGDDPGAYVAAWLWVPLDET